MRSESSTSSYQSQSTAPTEYSHRPRHYANEDGDTFIRGPIRSSPQTSTETYESGHSEEDLAELPELPEGISTDPEGLSQIIRKTSAVPATPRDFSDLFPSGRPLLIRHDDATLDGNMNLRVDTPIFLSEDVRHITLFHLRMHDLRHREFSLRRYCRESGREVCHSLRKYQKPAVQRRPTLQKSFSTAMAAVRPKPPSRQSTGASGLRRHDSGYASVHAVEVVDPEPEASPRRHSLLPTNTVKLEFSNYAHVDVKRRGYKSHKHYDFEYWGKKYSWKRSTGASDDHGGFGFHLVQHGGSLPLAHIVPTPLSGSQQREEAEKGGWIPPCTMHIADDDIIDDTTDISE